MVQVADLFLVLLVSQNCVAGCLFIQLEYCYTTLTEVIDQGQLWQQSAERGENAELLSRFGEACRGAVEA